MTDVPSHWYNIAADLPKPLPPLVDPPGLDSRIRLLTRILPSRLIEEENTLARYIPIPEEVREAYKGIGRPTSLVRARGLERRIGNGKARIYYKMEASLPGGSHKINTALAQAFYALQDGAREVVTETGAGQWGLAVSMAAARLGLKTTVFMTRSSYESKRQRRSLMEFLGAAVYPSPSTVTRAGRSVEDRERHPGSLGLAIAEAVEYTLESEDRRYLPGSALEAVLTHQTVIGLEALSQMEEEPDYMIACVGGGSNLAGFMYPAIGAMLRGEGFEKTRFIAAESTAAPKLTQGEYRYDGFEPTLILPLAKMYTLGKDYTPPPLHAAGLRYHAAAASLSLLHREGIIDAVAIPPGEVLEAARVFAASEGVIPAPESAHAIAAAVRIARAARRETVIVFNLSGHGLLDTDAYSRLEARGP